MVEGRRRRFCDECGEYPVPEHIEKGEEWVCPECQDLSLGINFLNFLKDKISQTLTEPEDEYRFVFRELVQNADDAGATQLVARFQDDALVVANDGEPFRTGSGGDFERIGQVLGGHKEEDPNKVGNFGSGFQTVYSITNNPEIHSSGQAIRFDPPQPEVDRVLVLDDERQDSPYAPDGVLFRFPWRDDEAARAEYDGSTPFQDANDWPRWDRKSKREFFEELSRYAHDLILCTKNLQKIRIIWEVAGDEEAIQVRKDYRCQPEAATDDDEDLTNIDHLKGEITEEEGEGGWTGFNVQTSRSYEYLILHTCVQDRSAGDGIPEWVVSSEDGKVGIVSSEEKPESLLKYNDVWLFLPLFPAEKRGTRGEGKFVYSVIPLTRRTKNNFVLSAHLFPEENRKDIDIRGHNGVSGEWYIRTLETAAWMYKAAFEPFTELVKNGTNQPLDEKERTIWDALPASDLGDWMRPGRNRVSGLSTRHVSKIEARVTRTPILHNEGLGWIKPANAVLEEREVGQRILERLQRPHITERFLEHPRCNEAVVPNLQDQRFDASGFVDVWSEGRGSIRSEHGEDNMLEYGQQIGPTELDRDLVGDLISYCLLREDAPNVFHKIPLVPDEEGTLRRFKDLRRPPDDAEELLPLVPPNRRPHPDFEDALGDRIEAEANAKEMLKRFEDWPGSLDDPVAAATSLFDYVAQAEDDRFPERRVLKRGSYRFIPDKNDELQSITQVRYVDSENFEAAKALFDRAGMDVRWVHEPLLRAHPNLLEELEIPRPDFPKLVRRVHEQGLELDEQERCLVVEGMLRKQDKGALGTKAFLPSGNRLLRPSQGLWGSTGSRKVDQLVGVIDQAVQDGLDDHPDLRSKLRDLRVFDVHPKAVLDRLEARFDEEPELFSPLDDEVWEGMTRLLAYLVEHNMFGGARSRQVLLPVEHGGERKVAQGPPDLGRSHWPESYKRDYVFIRPEEDPPGLHDEVAHQLKFLDLHPDVEIDIGKVKDTFQLVELSTANLARHLIAGVNDASLFDPAVLQDFVGTKDDQLLDEIRTTLLEGIREHFDSEKQETGLSPNDMKRIPLLYDVEEEWAPPKEFVGETRVDLGFLGIRSLHSDFKDWPRETLRALGVKETADPSLVTEHVQGSRGEEDRQQLATTLLYLLSSRAELTEEYDSISDLDWIPTRDGGYNVPSSAILPTETNEVVLGEEHRNLIDIDAADEGVLLDGGERDLVKALDEERARKLGINPEPPFRVLIERISEQQDMEAQAPGRLFSLVSKHLRDEESASTIEEDLGYYAGGQWYDPEDIFLREIPPLPPDVKVDLLVEPEPEHEPYLEAIGAKTSFDAEDILQWLTEAENEAKALWRELVAHREEIDDDLRERFSHGSMPIRGAETPIEPGSCIIDEQARTRVAGGYLFAGLDRYDEDELRTLERLGGRYIDDLRASEALKLQEELPVHPRAAPLHRRLLSVLYRKAQPSMEPKVVCSIGGRLELVRIEEAWLPDHSASQQFDDVPFIEQSFIPSGASFEAWAGRHGMERLSEHLTLEPRTFDWEDGEPDADQAKRLSAIGKVLDEKYGEHLPGLDPFGWLETLEVRRRPRLPVKRTFKGRPETGYASILPETESPPNSIFIPERGPERYILEAAQTLVSLARDVADDWVPPEEEQDLKRDIQAMLRHDPQDWSDHVGVDHTEVTTAEVLDSFIEIVDDWGGEAYYEIRQKLTEWYPGCQICRKRTPAGVEDNRSEETLKSIISKRGGRYHGERPESTGNSLWLCPNHQTLYTRGLVKLSFLEHEDIEGVRSMKENLEKALSNKEAREDELRKLEDGIFCEVALEEYDVTGDVRRRVEDEIIFRVGHLREVLDTMERYLEVEGTGP